MLPLGFKLEGAEVLVVGAGAVGVRKARQLCDAGARVTVVSRELLFDPPENVQRVERRSYLYGDLEGYALVVSATGNPNANDEIVREAHQRGVWLNVVDDPERSTFYFMALHREGDVTVAVTTNGASPALAQELRDLVGRSLPRSVAAVAAALRNERQFMHEHGQSTEGYDWRTRIRELLRQSDAS
jgi:siroheme synthase-like protein